MNNLNAYSYIILPREEYGGEPANIDVPDIFSCDLQADDTLKLKKGFSTYTFPSGKTFHDIITNRDYKIIELLGSGVANTTYLVEIEGEKYLLRTPSYFLVNHMNNTNIRKYVRKSLNNDYFRECVHLTILSPSQYIMKLLACECSDNVTVMIMEYVPGMRLDTWLQTEPKLYYRQKVLNELTEGLEYIHSKLIAHYDIKPANIFVPSNKSRPAFFIDFGISGRRATRNSGWNIMKNYNNQKMKQVKNTIRNKRETKKHTFVPKSTSFKPKKNLTSRFGRTRRSPKNGDL